jgi:hypothetical protein
MYLTNFFFMEAVLIKNKLFTTGIAALTLAFAIVIMGCDTEATQVEGTVNTESVKASAPGKPTLEPGTLIANEYTYSKLYLVKWPAADDGIGYTLYVREEGKKTIKLLNSETATNTLTYLAAVADSISVSNTTDSDAWNAIVTVSRSSIAISSGKSIRIGVRTTSNASGKASSDIVWSDPVTF